MPLTIDFTNMMAGPLPGGAGITPRSGRMAPRDSPRRTRACARARGRYARLHRPARDQEALAATLAVARQHGGQVDDVVLLGIGGSALGPIALRTALRPPHWNELDTPRSATGWPRLHTLDNVDPGSIACDARRDLVLARTLVLVVSKSGGTVETMAQYLIVRAALDAAAWRDGSARHG
jgi:glucose-6-phosphate isomerase